MCLYLCGTLYNKQYNLSRISSGAHGRSGAISKHQKSTRGSNRCNGWMLKLVYLLYPPQVNLDWVILAEQQRESSYNFNDGAEKVCEGKWKWRECVYYP